MRPGSNHRKDNSCLRGPFFWQNAACFCLLFVASQWVARAETLYLETFPYPGPDGGVVHVSTVGWGNDITNNPNRLFQENEMDGAVFAFQGTKDVPISTAFYTTTNLDSGATGPAFPSIDPSDYFCVILSADLRAGIHGDNIEVRFCIEMDSAGWFVSSTPLPVPSARGPFNTYSQAFTTNSPNWQTLALRGTHVEIGGASPQPLAGRITGAGLVFTHTVDNGTFDFDNFRITASRGDLRIARDATKEGGPAATVSWVGAPGIRLQSTPSLELPWNDVPDTSGKSSCTLPAVDPRGFFRLVKD